MSIYKVLATAIISVCNHKLDRQGIASVIRELLSRVKLKKGIRLSSRVGSADGRYSIAVNRCKSSGLFSVIHFIIKCWIALRWLYLLNGTDIRFATTRHLVRETSQFFFSKSKHSQAQRMGLE
jgi:hypothetical protein